MHGLIAILAAFMAISLSEAQFIQPFVTTSCPGQVQVQSGLPYWYNTTSLIWSTALTDTPKFLSLSSGAELQRMATICEFPFLAPSEPLAQPHYHSRLRLRHAITKRHLLRAKPSLFSLTPACTRSPMARFMTPAPQPALQATATTTLHRQEQPANITLHPRPVS